MLRPVIYASCLLATSLAFAHHHSGDSAKTKTAEDPLDVLMQQWKREGRRLNFVADHDHDGDSRVSSMEFEQSRRDRFDITDTNDDGIVDQQEYVYEWEDRLDARIEDDRESRVNQTYVRFEAMDKDDDAFMSWDEYAASGDRIFTGWDTNDDNVIDANDPPRESRWTPKAESEMTAEELTQRNERKMAWARSTFEMPTTHRLEGVMARYDLDENGSVGRDEFDGKRRADYDATDYDGNGTLDADEYADEFQDRMDPVIETYRAESVEQSHRRFEALDNNDDGAMTFAEYRESGNRIFARYDVTEDGYVKFDDPLPRPFEELANEPEVAAANVD
ncbi:MAG: hypothetical protein AAF351_01845 [Pseudomonadota bacterium]